MGLPFGAHDLILLRQGFGGQAIVATMLRWFTVPLRVQPLDVARLPGPYL